MGVADRSHAHLPRDRKLEHLAHLDKIGVQPKGLAQEPFVSRQAVQTYTSTVWQDEESFKFKALHFRIPEGDIDDPREICVWNAKVRSASLARLERN